MANKRFYDRDKSVHAAVNITRELPKDMQGVIAEGLNQVAIRDYKIDERMNTLKSMGTDKILPLYKSKNKRRDYDQVPEFHTAMNYLRVLEEDEQREVAKKVVDLAEFAQDYIERCRFVALIPDQRKVALVRDTYLSMERAQAQQYLEAVKEEFMVSLRPAVKESQEFGYIAGGSTIHLGEF